MHNIFTKILLVILAVLFIPLYANAGSKITGKITDKSTGTPLPGANVILENTGLGSSTDLEGEYFISNVPPGTYNLKVMYLGYKAEAFEIVIPDNVTLEHNATLEYMVLETEELVITAQAEGQMQAINQQITSNSITNVVSSAKIQELPEANAAEAVGRLPGVSLQREGGEGNKVVIRGLSPKYNKVKIEGISMTANGDEDRSVDLSMISPNILAGIEVSKTAMADQEADNLGGSVNFLLQTASDKPSLNVIAQGGYNGLREEFGNSYFVLGGGMRFFDDQLGVFVQGNYENRDRSSNSVFSNYQIPQLQNQGIYQSIPNSIGFQDIERDNERIGGVVVLDYDLTATKIKFSNTFNKINTETFQRQEYFNATGREHTYLGRDTIRNMFSMMNTLNVEHIVGDVKLSGGVSYVKSDNEVPESISMNAIERAAFATGWTPTDSPLPPDEIPGKALNNVKGTVINTFDQYSSKLLEEEYSANLNAEWSFNASVAEIKLKMGGKYKHKYRKYDLDANTIPLGWQDLMSVRAYLANKLNVRSFNPGYDPTDDLPYEPFIEAGYDPGDFMAGNFSISRVPGRDIIVDTYHDLENIGEIEGRNTIYRNHVVSELNDYNGTENYYAAYIMPVITFGENKLVVIPGFRYEYNKTQYSALRVNDVPRDTDPVNNAYKATSEKNNDFFLPMLHAKYQVFEWFDIRASYTHTISRPDYIRLIPTWTTSGSSLTWNNVNLVPSKSENIDLFFSFYTNKIGLITLGGFIKNIEDFIFPHTLYLFEASQLQPEWPSTVRIGGTVNGYINSSNLAKLKGVEVEWQSNFWFLPGALKGLVVAANYTYTHSNLAYPKQLAVKVGVPPRTVGQIDVPYEDRLLDQPTHIVNLTVGFDYEGFSIRGSMQYKSDVFMETNADPFLRQSTEPIRIWDLKLRQKLPVSGLQVFFNINNISKSIDQTTNQGAGWFSNKGYYGMSADMGLSYNL
ncbi:MAG: TonB-dependent receptor [Ignavibacteriaceae bacterium]